jgi:hypothetical protein
MGQTEDIRDGEGTPETGTYSNSAMATKAPARRNGPSGRYTRPPSPRLADSHRTGLGPPPDVAALRDQIQALRQENLDLRHRAEEREEELAAAREANRRLMTELNKAQS